MRITNAAILMIGLSKIEFVCSFLFYSISSICLEKLTLFYSSYLSIFIDLFILFAGVPSVVKKRPYGSSSDTLFRACRVGFCLSIFALFLGLNSVYSYCYISTTLGSTARALFCPGRLRSFDSSCTTSRFVLSSGLNSYENLW